MDRRGAGFAAFSGLADGAADVDAGVAGDSAFDLRIPFGVEVPLEVWRAASEVVGLTILGTQERCKWRCTSTNDGERWMLPNTSRRGLDLGADEPTH